MSGVQTNVSLRKVSTFLSLRAGKFVSKRQKAWFEATQQRINFTAEILGSMKSVKMLGLTEKMTSAIAKLRFHEVELSKSFRKLMAFNIMLGMAAHPPCSIPVDTLLTAPVQQSICPAASRSC